MTKRLRLTIRDEEGGARLTPALVDRLRAELEGATDALVVTLESQGTSFCEGMDLGGLAAREGDTAALEGFATLLRAIAIAPRPVVALVDGPAIGGGVGLAAAADRVIATTRATFGLPETLFGLVPATILPSLVRRVGPTRARWLAMGAAATMTAEEAWRIGLVDELTDDLDASLAPIVHRLERLDADAVAAAKSLAAMLDAEPPPRYHDEAMRTLRQRLERRETSDRIARFLAGDTPWSDPGAT